MAISTIQGNIRRAKTKITDLRKKLSKEQETEGKARREILQIKKGLGRTTSQSIARTKLSKIDRLNKSLENSSKEQGSLNKKIVEEEKKLLRYEDQLIKEEAREIKKQVNMQTRRDTDHALNQQRLLNELSEYKSAIKTHTEELASQEIKVEQFDVFISHASEDKESFVRPLAETLNDSGIKVWYDEYKLTWGKSTRRSIDKGLANCRFGIVVFSEAFFNKGWTNYELDGLVSRNISEGNNLILPIWHNVSQNEVRNFSPSLADLTALKSDNMSIDEIAEQLIELLKEGSFDVEVL